MERELAGLVERIRTHPNASFYASRWGGASRFEDVPFVSRTDMGAAPLRVRSYKEESGMMKLVRTPTASFLSAWSFSDIGAEAYGVASKRPISYFSDSRESLEKAMWCYERNVVPLVGEQNATAARRAAELCDIDSLMTDMRALQGMRPYLEARGAPLESVSIIDSEFSTGLQPVFAQYAKSVRLVLALPETGAFAEATLDTFPTFSVLPNCTLEVTPGGELVLTKTAMLITPIIRYATGLTGIVGGTHGTQTVSLS